MVSRRLSRALEASRGIRPRRRRAAASLRVYFSGIHSSVRALLAEQIGKLKYRYRKKNDAAEAEMDRLTAELKTLPERWSFVERK